MGVTGAAVRKGEGGREVFCRPSAILGSPGGGGGVGGTQPPEVLADPGALQSPGGRGTIAVPLACCSERRGSRCSICPMLELRFVCVEGNHLINSQQISASVTS